MKKSIVWTLFPLLAAGVALADIPIAIPDFSVTSGTPYVWLEDVVAGDTVYGLNFVADWSDGGGIPWSSEFEALVTPPVGDAFDWDPIGGQSSGADYHFDATVDDVWLEGVGSDGQWSFSFDTSYGGSTAILQNVTMTLLTTPPVVPLLSEYSIATLTDGSSVSDNNGNYADVLNGPNGFGSGSWSGGDAVYTLDWPGGDLLLDLLFVDDLGDIDLFLWDNDPATPPVLGSSTSVTDNEQIEVLGLAAGAYWVHVDGWAGAANDYTLNVTPEPASLALLVLGVALLRRR